MTPSTVTRRTLLAGAGITLAALGPLDRLAASAAPPPPPAPDSIEPEGVRDQRMGKGLMRDGRAALPLHPHARRVWLDTTRGADGDGRSAEAPFSSEERAYAHWRNGDHLMIAGGSVLTAPVSAFRATWGRDATFPSVIQSYDRAAPDDAARHGLLANGVVYRGREPMISAFGKGSGASYSAVRGIAFDHRASEVLTEYGFVAGIDWLLLEQCAFLGAQLSLNCRSGTRAHIIRQCAFYGQWARERRAQGIFSSDNHDTVIEDCVFYHCGWRDGQGRETPGRQGGPTIFNHAIYMAVRSGGILRRCVMMEPASHGAQLRGSWISHDNMFIACPLALLHGGGTNYAIEAPDGVTAHAYRNIVTIARDIAPNLPRGVGIEAINTRPGSRVEQCLIVGARSETAKAGLSAIAQQGAGYEPNRTIIEFARNTNDWNDRGFDEGSGGAMGWPDRIQLADRDNIARAEHIAFADRRDGITAARALGYAGLADLGMAMVADPARGWAAEIAAHIRPGYAPSPQSIAKLRNPDGTLRGAVLPDGRWNDGAPFSA